MPISLQSDNLHLLYLRHEADTQALGTALARILVPGLAIYCSGEIGVGKTALIRALLYAIGQVGCVKSPTYALAESYTIGLAGREVPLIHFDLYRMGHPTEFLEAGFRDYFDGQHICIIEWPEKGEHENGDNVLPAPDIQITMSLIEHGREVKLQAISSQGTQCLMQLTNQLQCNSNAFLFYKI